MKTHVENQVIVLAWCEKTGIRDTGKVEQRDCNWFPVFEPCWEGKAIVFSRDMREKQRAKEHAATLSDKPIVRVFVMEDADNVLSLARQKIMDIFSEQMT